MWVQEERNGEPTEEQPSISHTFRHVYGFILRAVQGDVAVASALFQRYLAGELPEELLALSRRCVQNDQKAGELGLGTQGARPLGSRSAVAKDLRSGALADNEKYKPATSVRE
jgi:hypothetical protein